MDLLLDELNDAQKSAVTSPASVVQVLAPPGSGKTKTLTARVAYLINHERLRPWNIVVCTFTIKAAREMKERIRGMVGDGVEAKLILGTFHSVARRFLVRYGQEIGIDKNFGIADTTDSTAIIKRIIKRGDYTLDPSAARSRISGLKAKGTTVDEYARTTKNAEQHEFTCIYSEYEDALKASNLLDYDDLLLRCVDLLRKHPACVSSIEAVLIDEYQDTNNVQYELMTLLAQRMKRITIVGDPDQSIYGFRSAEIKNLHRMQKDYPDSLVVNLENNYRSSGCILSSAMAVIEQDESRPSKSLQATHCVGEQPTLRHLADEHVEADWIVEEIQRSRTLAAGLLNFSDYAILLRTASLSLSIESKLGNAGIPYRMVGGRRFFERAEVKIVLDYLRAIDQPNHNDALARILNVPSRKIGEVTVKRLLEEAELSKTSLWNLLLNSAKGEKPATKISSQAQKGIDVFVNLVLTSRAKLLPEDGGYCNLWDLITHVVQKISLEAYLKKTYPENWKDRWANIEELGIQATQMAAAVARGEAVSDDTLPVVDGIEQRDDTAADLLSKFLSNVALSTEVEKPDGEEPNQVSISTIHAAKGLEWPVVFIPAVYDGQIPHSKAEDHNEERRLLYVGMTRAKALLYLSCPVKQGGHDETTLSPFLSLPDVQKLFSQTGPSIGCSVITDLAQILRRPCPSSSEVEAARALLERVEDDKYPASRDRIDGHGIIGELGDEQRDGFKRRKLGHFSNEIKISTTMQSSSSFSVATATIPSGQGGFTTARTHHKILQEAKAVEALVSASSWSAGKAAYIASQRADTAEPKTARGKAVKRRAAGQGAITNFFKKPVPTAGDVSQPPIMAPLASLQSAGPPVVPIVPSLLRPQSSGPGYKPLNDISNVPQQSNRTYRPPTISSHRPRNAPMVSKPKRPDIDSGADNEGTRYLLLSSSPVKPDDELVLGEAGISEDVDEPTSPIRFHPKTDPLLSNGFRAASTLHSTSVAQVQSSGGIQRKTLGMRRSVQGWTVKHQQPPRPRQ